MRKGFAMVLAVTILFAGGYFYYIAQAVCPIPRTYSLGELDERFNLTADEAKLVIAEAEAVWEDATGKNLFSASEEGDLVINFVYDERQEFVEAEGELKEKLDATENISEAIGETYATLVAEYNELQLTYADKVEAYERRLSEYNAEVEKYNKEGGAPADVYESLSKQKRALSKEQSELNELASKLSVLVDEINNIGERGNKIINTYNQGVNVYNETFGESQEFTQGDYSNNVIKLYTFENKTELKLVLVHELGHALSLDHVEGENSAMFYLIGDQNPNITLTDQDLAEFDRVCGEKSIYQKVKLSLGL
jgi:hypothetical protein